jgi:hypothetical protein
MTDNLFIDKVYESFDDLSVLCEPVIDPLNEILAQAPEKTVLSGIDALFFIGDSIDSSDRTSEFISHFVDKLMNGMRFSSWHQSSFAKSVLSSKFTVNITDGIVDMLNPQNSTFSVEIVKKENSLSEREMDNRLLNACSGELRDSPEDRQSYNRAIDILSLLDVSSDLHQIAYSRSNKYKLFGAIKQLVASAIENRRWMLKSVELSEKVGKWMNSYLADNNQAAYINFCKFIVMTHSGAPIYSIEEELV